MADPEYPFSPIKIGNPCQTCCGLCKSEESDPIYQPYANCCYETPPSDNLKCYNTRKCGACITINDTTNIRITNLCIDDRFNYPAQGKKLCLNGECYSSCWKLQNNNIVPNYDTNTDICCDFSGAENTKPNPEKKNVKDSCWECKEEKISYNDIYGVLTETSKSIIHEYCTDRKDGKTSCCYGECYDPNDLCIKCDENEKKVLPKCPLEKDNPEKDCCAGICFDKNEKCQICDEKTGKIITNPQCAKCCPVIGVDVTTYACCKDDTPDCCDGIGCFKEGCQQCQ